MDKAIELAGHLASYGGVAVCLAAGVARLLGYYGVSGYSVQSIFVLGMGAMLFACLAKLHGLSVRE
jgi:hypothetical protein